MKKTTKKTSKAELKKITRKIKKMTNETEFKTPEDTTRFLAQVLILTRDVK